MPKPNDFWKPYSIWFCDFDVLKVSNVNKWAFQRNSKIEPFIAIIRAEHSNIPSGACKLHKQPQRASRYPLMTSLSLFRAYIDNTKHKQTHIDAHRHPQTPRGAKGVNRHCKTSSGGLFGRVGMFFFACFAVLLSCWGLVLCTDV